jgi:branched-chain amino acid transport system substrate-binding protein
MIRSSAKNIVSVIACCALVFLVSCAEKPEIIKIGAILPFSGSAAELGNQYLHGLQLAVEELNASNPEVLFELVIDSDQNDPGAALASFKNQLVKKKILVSIVATRASCLTVVPQAEIEFVPVFANCGHPLITTMHINAFRNVPNAALEIRTMAHFISASLKVDGIAVLYSNDDSGTDAAKAVKNELSQNGIRILATEPFIEDKAVLESAVTLALAEKPGAVWIFGGGKAAADLLAGIRKSGYRGALIGSSDFADPDFAALAKESLEGCYYSMPTIALSGNPGFADRYRKRFNAEPSANSIFEYDAMRIIAKAVEIKRAEKVSMTNALKKVGDFSGAAGGYAYVEREWLPQVSIVQVRAGARVAIQ